MDGVKKKKSCQANAIELTELFTVDIRIEIYQLLSLGVQITWKQRSSLGTFEISILKCFIFVVQPN